MAIYGYCRISTAKQSIERQVRNIREQFQDAVIFQEQYTGTKLDRPEWRKLCRKLISGDTIVFDSVSRMSRNAEEGFSLYKTLYERNVDLVFLKERHIDTEVFRETATNAVPCLSSSASAKILVEAIAIPRLWRSLDYLVLHTINIKEN